MVGTMHLATMAQQADEVWEPNVEQNAWRAPGPAPQAPYNPALAASPPPPNPSLAAATMATSAAIGLDIAATSDDDRDNGNEDEDEDDDIVYDF